MDNLIEASASNKIGPLSSNGTLNIHGGIPGCTSISMQRRIHDSRFATRYFVGHGLDVGGGQDSLALFMELFPMIRNIVIYDAPQGDAQKLANVDDGTFDFLFSSHCLEHMRDPVESLHNWIRVVSREDISSSPCRTRICTNRRFGLRRSIPITR
jgi:hypothetical protein